MLMEQEEQLEKFKMDMDHKKYININIDRNKYINLIYSNIHQI